MAPVIPPSFFHQKMIGKNACACAWHQKQSHSSSLKCPQSILNTLYLFVLLQNSNATQVSFAVVWVNKAIATLPQYCLTNIVHSEGSDSLEQTCLMIICSTSIFPSPVITFQRMSTFSVQIMQSSSYDFYEKIIIILGPNHLLLFWWQISVNTETEFAHLAGALIYICYEIF